MLCPHCICVFCIYLRTNSDLCHLQHKLIGFYNRDEKCLQRGTDWVFNYHTEYMSGISCHRCCFVVRRFLVRNRGMITWPMCLVNFSHTFVQTQGWNYVTVVHCQVDFKSLLVTTWTSDTKPAKVLKTSPIKQLKQTDTSQVLQLSFSWALESEGGLEYSGFVVCGPASLCEQFLVFKMEITAFFLKETVR